MTARPALRAAAPFCGIIAALLPSRGAVVALSTPRPRPPVLDPESPIATTGVDMDAWRRGFANCPRELPPTIVPVDDLPSDFPIGTHYRNGHARFVADDGTRVLHPFDADGMVVAMTFDPENKRMLFRNRYVETEGYLKDRETGGMSERGLFGTRRSGGVWRNAFRASYKHVANTNVVHSGDGDLYALWEGGKPYVLDPLTLRNKRGRGGAGTSDLGGLIEENFGAHPRYDPDRNTYVNFGSVYDPTKSEFKVSLYEVDATTFRSKHASIPNFVLGAPALLHDFVLTNNYCIFNINDTRINTKSAIKALLGFGGFAGTIEVNEEAKHSNIVFVPRALFDEDQSRVENIDPFGDDRIKVVPVDKHFNFHYANAFEDADGHVVFDTVRVDEIDLSSDGYGGAPVWEKDNPFEAVTPGRMMRYTVDVANERLAAGCGPNPRTLTSRLPEFPSIPLRMSTREHRYIYPGVARTRVDVDPTTKGLSCPLGGIAKVDALDPTNNEYFSFEPHEFPGEAVLCPKAGRKGGRPSPEAEDACYLLANVVNGRDGTTELVIFDVEGTGSLERGPVARCPLPVFVPHMLHGSFAEGVMFDFGPFETQP